MKPKKKSTAQQKRKSAKEHSAAIRKNARKRAKRREASKRPLPTVPDPVPVSVSPLPVEVPQTGVQPEYIPHQDFENFGQAEPPTDKVTED